MRFRYLPVLLALGLGLKAADTPPDNFAKFRGAHPRLIARPVDWETLKNKIGRDKVLAGYVNALRRDAFALTEKSPVTYEMTGKRLLSVSRESVHRITTLAFCQRLQPHPALLAQAIREMEALANFPDWNPSHFLDTAEAAAALGLGYDWLYDQLPLSTRELVHKAIVNNALKLVVGSSSSSRHTWLTAEMNWNQVCLGGLTTAALAVAEDEPEMAREMVALALRHNPSGLIPYAPEGVYPEGPGYWNYGTTYQVLLLSCLESALGSDFGLSAAPGFMASAGVQAQLHGPTGLAFNFSDGGEKSSFEPAYFWFAQKLRQPALLSLNTNHLKAYVAAGSKETPDNRFSALAALWWPDQLTLPPPSLPLRWQGNGANPVAVFRDSWTDPKALYLATKGGSASLNHAHMDAGSFVLEADGVRWARDLGAQEYNSLESKGIALFSRGQDAERWTVFRLNNRSHGTLTINDELHHEKGRATLSRFSADPKDSFAILDLSPVFETQAKSVTRGFRLLPARSVLIQDELGGLAADDNVRWAMVSGAEIQVNGAEATLTQDGQTLRARLIAPADAVFEVISADPPENEYDAPNPDRRILTINAKAPASGVVGIAVVLRPGAAPLDPASLPKLESTTRWGH